MSFVSSNTKKHFLRIVQRNKCDKEKRKRNENEKKEEKKPHEPPTPNVVPQCILGKVLWSVRAKVYKV